MWTAMPMASPDSSGCWARWLPITVKRLVWRELSWTTPAYGFRCGRWGWFLPGIRDWVRVRALGFSESIRKVLRFLGGQALAPGFALPAGAVPCLGFLSRLHCVQRLWSCCCAERRAGNRSQSQPGWAYSLARVSLRGGRKGGAWRGSFSPEFCKRPLVAPEHGAARLGAGKPVGEGAGRWLGSLPGRGCGGGRGRGWGLAGVHGGGSFARSRD